MECDVRQLQRVAARLTYGLNVLFTASDEVPSFNCQLKELVERVFKLLPDLQEIEVLGMLRRDPQTVGYLGILVEVVTELAELCCECAGESFLLSSSSLCIKQSEVVESLDNKLTWAFASMGYTGKPLLPRQQDVWTETNSYIKVCCNRIIRSPLRSKVVVVSGGPRRTTARRLMKHLKSSGYIDQVVSCKWFSAEAVMTNVLLQAGMLHTGSTQQPLARHVLHGTYKRCLSASRLCLLLHNVPIEVIDNLKAPATQLLHNDIKQLLPSFKSNSIGRLVIIVSSVGEGVLAGDSDSEQDFLLQVPPLEPSSACSMATMRMLDFLHSPSKMVRQREKLHRLVTRWDDPFLVSVASATINVVASNATGETPLAREQARRALIDKMLDTFLDVEPRTSSVLTKLLGLLPPPPIPGRDIKWLLASLCEVFVNDIISPAAASFILDVPFMYMLTALEQLKHIGFAAYEDDHCRLHGCAVQFIKTTLGIEDAMKNKLVSRQVIYQSWVVWKCRQECDLGSTAKGIQNYISTLHNTQRATQAGLRTKDPAILHLSLSLMLHCGWLEAEFMCASMPSIIRIALKIASLATVEHRSQDTDRTVYHDGSATHLSDSDNDLVDVPLVSPPSTPKACSKLPKPYVQESEETVNKALHDACKVIQDRCSESLDQYWTDAATALDAMEVECSVSERAYLYTLAYDVIGHLLSKTRSKWLHKIALGAARLASQVHGTLSDSSIVDINAFCSATSLPVSDDPFIGQMSDRLCTYPLRFNAWRLERAKHIEINKVRNLLLQAECLSQMEAFPEVEQTLAELDTAECLKVNNSLKRYVLHSTSRIRLKGVNYRESLDDATQALSICRQLQPLSTRAMVLCLLAVVDVNLEQGRFIDADRSLTKCLRLMTGKKKENPVGVLTPSDVEGYLSLLDSGTKEVLALMCEVLARVAGLLSSLEQHNQAVAICSRIRVLVAECMSEQHPLYVQVLLCSAHAHAMSAADQNLGALKLYEEAERVTAQCYGNVDEVAFMIRLKIAEHLLAVHDTTHAEVVARKVLYVALGATEWQGLGDTIQDPVGYEAAEGWIQWWDDEGSAAVQHTSYSHTLVYEALRVLGSIRSVMGDTSGSYKLTKSASDILAKVAMYTMHDTPVHPATPAILKQLAAVSETDREAIEHLASAIRVARVLYGHRHINVSPLLDRLGKCYAAQKKYEAACESHREALELARCYMVRVNKCHRSKVKAEASGSDISSVSSTSTGEQGAAQVTQMGVSYPFVVVKGMVTPVHPCVAVSLKCLGDACYSLGQEEESLHYHDESLEVLKMVHTTQSVPYVLGLVHVGNIHFSSMRWAKAERIFKTCLEISELVMSDRHTAKPNILTALGTTLERRGCFQEATEYFERALKCKQRSAYSTREEVAQAFQNLGINCYNRKDMSAAKAYMESCLHFRRDAGIQETHHSVYSVLNWISWLEHVAEHPESWTLQRHDVPTSVASTIAATISSFSKSFFTQ
eukprot:TRINITY_DN18865_c0_g1_i1.p1 TRINITY_DN18865_c0_g1~~TRINITY_DN18865_c0_g1_i1.p1  ORF type:complete len:1488 (+),score=293.53 TRINITY_DN18865_c0_g1_i1:78-4541(+)